MMQLTLAIAAKTLLNVDVGAEADMVSECIDVVMADFEYRFQSNFPLPRWVPTTQNRRVKRAIARLDDLILSIIDSRRASGEDRGDLLSMLVQARDEDDGRGMTDRQLRDEVMTLLLAGHETTAVTLSWTWYLLGRHPEVEAGLLAEIDTVIGNRSPTPADFPRLMYCERVVREAMRLFPPAFIIGRRAKEPVTIGGTVIPPGTNVLMSQWVVQRDPRWFDDPLAFHPDRWADNLAGRIPKYAYFPFGGGPRVCIGNQFAMLEAVLLLATILPKFRIELDPAQQVVPRPAVTLRPADGIRAVVTPRERDSASARVLAAGSAS
jgi:cytochrome P450